MNKLLIVLSFVLPGAPALAQVQIPQVPARPPQAVTPGGAPTLTPGLYVQVIDGLINVSNAGGSQSFAAGQFGFTPSPTQPPVILPKNPGLQFTPPPVFNPATPTASTASTPSKSNTVDCEVR